MYLTPIRLMISFTNWNFRDFKKTTKNQYNYEQRKTGKVFSISIR